MSYYHRLYWRPDKWCLLEMLTLRKRKLSYFDIADRSKFLCLLLALQHSSSCPLPTHNCSEALHSAGIRITGLSLPRLHFFFLKLWILYLLFSDQMAHSQHWRPIKIFSLPAFPFAEDWDVNYLIFWIFLPRWLCLFSCPLTNLREEYIIFCFSF